MKKTFLSAVAMICAVMSSAATIDCYEGDSCNLGDVNTYTISVDIVNKGYNCYPCTSSCYESNLYGGLKEKIQNIKKNNRYGNLLSVKKEANFIQRTIENMNDGTIVKMHVFNTSNEKVAEFNLEKYNYRCEQFHA